MLMRFAGEGDGSATGGKIGAGVGTAVGAVAAGFGMPATLIGPISQVCGLLGSVLGMFFHTAAPYAEEANGFNNALLNGDPDAFLHLVCSAAWAGPVSGAPIPETYASVIAAYNTAHAQVANQINPNVTLQAAKVALDQLEQAMYACVVQNKNMGPDGATDMAAQLLAMYTATGSLTGAAAASNVSSALSTTYTLLGYTFTATQALLGGGVLLAAAVLLLPKKGT